MAEVASLEPNITSVKALAESSNLTTIPATYTITSKSDEPVVSDAEVSVPIIDFSLLVSGNPDERSQAIFELGKACENWGFFAVINHGVQETLMKEMVEGCKGFFDLPEEEKLKCKGKHVLDPIRYGTSFNTCAENVFCWRDYLKVFVHPVFHTLPKPLSLSEIMLEYSKRTKEIVRELLKGISEGLGLEGDYMEKVTNFENGQQICVANYYPICPQPALAVGLPCHSDHGLLTLLIHNGVSGLQVQHQGKWVNLSTLPANSFLVNTADHLEILTNGKYKSVLHRAVVNNKATRISIAMTHGPSFDTVVTPAPQLLDGERKTPAYIGISYKEYVEFMQSNKLEGKCCLDRVRI